MNLRYFDLHPTREDTLGLSVAQSTCMRELVSTLEEFYKKEDWFVISRFAIYNTFHLKEYPAEPDVLVIKGVTRTELKDINLRSWKLVYPNRPAPSVVFDIVSPWFWLIDLYEKPAHYHTLGIREYFAYDPHRPLEWDRAQPLYGWRYSAGKIELLEPNADGWLWSEELNSWLVPDRLHLRLYTRTGLRRPTQVEAIQKDIALIQAKTALYKAETEWLKSGKPDDQTGLSEIDPLLRSILNLRLEIERLSDEMRGLGYDPDKL